MEAFTEDLKNILNGRAAPVTVTEIASHDASTFEPQTKQNICFIVGTVLFDQNKVLLVQEAKKSCYGTWYLPAGRVEPNETLIEAAKREVKEEAGYECELTSLVSVEFGSALWWRFNFIGTVTGGQLKSLAEKDSESLQANWFDIREVQQRNVKLRAKDILKVIDSALYYQSRQSSSKPLPLVLPAPHPFKSLFHRITLVTIPSNGNAQLLLKKTDSGLQVPTMMFGPSCHSLLETVGCLMAKAFGITSGSPTQLCGVLGVEYNGRPKFQHDGVCISTLHRMDLPEGRAPPQPQNMSYTWCPVEDPSILADLSKRINASDNIALINLHG